MIENLAPRIEAICNELIDASAEARGTFDLMEDFANPLPIRVIAELMGFDPTRYSDFLSYPNSPESQRKYAAGSREFLAYLYDLGRARLRAPGADLFSKLIQAHMERDALTPREIAFTCELFLVAGGETTAGLIGKTALALAAHPSQASEVLANPELIPSLIEEAIRYDGPFRADFRTTHPRPRPAWRGDSPGREGSASFGIS